MGTSVRDAPESTRPPSFARASSAFNTSLASDCVATSRGGPFASGSAPRFNSASAAIARLFDAARSNGVNPYASTASTSAPREIRNAVAC
jgi:hypothetical protein